MSKLSEEEHFMVSYPTIEWSEWNKYVSWLVSLPLNKLSEASIIMVGKSTLE